MKTEAKPDRRTQKIAGRARFAAAKVGAEYCTEYTDRRVAPPDCRTCPLRNGPRDCEQNPIGYRDWIMAQAYCTESERSVLVGLSLGR